MSIQFSGVIKPLGQINDQSRLQHSHGQHKHIVGDQIVRLDPYLQNQKGLHSHLHGEKEQSRPALAEALLQQKTEPVTETQTVQQKGGGRDHNQADGHHCREREVTV